jgi:hypothetical protein
LLLLLPGLATALAGPGLAEASQHRKPLLGRQVYIGAAVTMLVLLVVGFFNHRPFMANWYANLGALRMAQVELSVWDWDNSAWKCSQTEI